MSGTDTIERLLGARFAERAVEASPVAEPGPAILARVDHLHRRRRRRAMAGAGTAVVVAAALVALVLGARHQGTNVRVANDTTTTTAPGCAVSSTCEPGRVDVVVVGQLPPTYSPTSGTGPVQPPGQHVVVLTFTSSRRPVHTIGTSTRVLTVRVTTSSTSDADAFESQVADWTEVRVGIHPARATRVVVGAGTPAQSRVSYLQVRLSPTVTLSLVGEDLTTDQLIEVALSITVR
ncbi:MAG TPA: hypothetical protein VMT43_14445 [Acidimicrobiales bacterium]|nr:hypothetical protein [Acidimicrobiales bacterium]